MLKCERRVALQLRMSNLLHPPPRMPQHCRQREHITAVLRGHDQEVCGLKWSPNGQQLASGGNDNLLHIWDANNDRPTHRITSHQAAVKALAWCPFQSNLLASGGGTADRCIKFTNSHTGAVLNSIDTASQVCALQWSRHEREILSSHGFSQNQLCLWKYPSMVKVAEFTGHSSRVLHLTQSPDGTTVVSGAADETLRFWKVFAETSTAQKVSSFILSTLLYMYDTSPWCPKQLCNTVHASSCCALATQDEQICRTQAAAATSAEQVHVQVIKIVADLSCICRPNLPQAAIVVCFEAST